MYSADEAEYEASGAGNRDGAAAAAGGDAAALNGDTAAVQTDGSAAVATTLSVPEETGDTMLQRALQRFMTPASALAFMVFVLLYFPCIATFVAIKQEAGGWKWAIGSAVYTVILAWVMAFVVYRIALLF